MTLKVTDSKGVALAIKTGTFLSELIQSEGGDYDGFDIVFEHPIILKAYINYCFEAVINGPPSCFGSGCPSLIEHSSGVTFFYRDITLKRTSYERGQFSEFEFILN